MGATRDSVIIVIIVVNVVIVLRVYLFTKIKAAFLWAALINHFDLTYRIENYNNNPLSNSTSRGKLQPGHLLLRITTFISSLSSPTKRREKSS